MIFCNQPVLADFFVLCAAIDLSNHVNVYLYSTCILPFFLFPPPLIDWDVVALEKRYIPSNSIKTACIF
jgi:hypothetical protein